MIDEELPIVLQLCGGLEMSNRTSHIFGEWSAFLAVVGIGVLFFGLIRSESYGADRTTTPLDATSAEAREAAILKAVAAAVRPRRAWGPEQVTGKPDTAEAGDQQTAWASQTTDGQPE